MSSNTAYSVFLTIDLIIPSSTLAISKKLLSSVAAKLFLDNDDTNGKSPLNEAFNTVEPVSDLR